MLIGTINSIYTQLCGYFPVVKQLQMVINRRTLWEIFNDCLMAATV